MTDYTSRDWCPRHDKVDTSRAQCPECGRLLLTIGEYRASERYGSLPEV